MNYRRERDIHRIVSPAVSLWLIPLSVALLFPMTVSAVELPKNEVARVQRKFELVLKGAYMSQGPEARCVTAKLENWEQFPVMRCDYKSDSRLATAYVLTADANRLARWVVRACIEATGAESESCADKLVSLIQTASNAQFPAAGIVLEGKDNKCQKCCFRDGVTISFPAWRKVSRQWSSATDDELRLCLNSKPTFIGEFARIQSTTVSEYTANGGTSSVANGKNRTGEWLRVVRESYQRAWSSDVNELMIAKAKNCCSR